MCPNKSSVGASVHFPPGCFPCWVDISNHSSTGPIIDHKTKVFPVQQYLCKYLIMLQIWNVKSISVGTTLCNALDLVSLCVDVLRGNHTTTERAVITETRLHQNWKLSLKRSGVLNVTRRCGLTERAPFTLHGRLCAPCCSAFTCIYISFQACFILSKKKKKKKQRHYCDLSYNFNYFLCLSYKIKPL